MPYSRGSSQAWDRNQVSQIAGRFFPIWATREAQSLVKFMSTESVMLSNHLLFCHPLLVLSSIFPSIRVFANESGFLIRCQSIGASATASVLPMNTQGWFPLGLTGLNSLQSKGISRVFSCVVGRGCLLWPVHSLGRTLLAFALLHSVLQGRFVTF